MTRNTGTLVVVACTSCGQKNRRLVPAPLGKRARCGNCHADLPGIALDDLDDEDEDDDDLDDLDDDDDDTDDDDTDDDGGN